MSNSGPDPNAPSAEFAGDDPTQLAIGLVVRVLGEQADFARVPQPANKAASANTKAAFVIF